MSSIWKDLRDLFWPPLCPVCGERMPDGARTVCTVCLMDAPLTGFWTQVDNPVVRKFWGLVPVVNASAFLFFVRGNGYRDLIHGFKYYGRWRQALEMGAWYGGELAAGGLYAGVDVVVPVPLHLRKRRPRHFVRPLGIRCRDGDALAAIARCGELQQRGLHRKRCSRIHRLLSAGDRCNGKRKEHHPQRINFFHLLQ